jgi:hypothetical protein
MQRTAILLVVIMVTATTGCRSRRPKPEPRNLVPFTHHLREKYQLSDIMLKDLQYYLAGDMVLRREMSSDEASVTSGHKIKIINDRRVEEVRFQQFTPGVAVVVHADRLGVSFEQVGGLTFGSVPKSREKHAGKYMLFAKDWKNNQALLQYHGKEYYTYGIPDGFFILVDMKELRKFKKETRTVKGRRLETP